MFIAAAFTSPSGPTTVEIINLEFTLVVAVRIRLTCFFPVIHLVFNGTYEATKLAPAYGSQSHSFLDTKGCAVGTENLSMAGDNETFAKDIFKGCHDPFVQRGASQKHHPLSYFPIAHYPVEVIMNNRIAQTPYEIFQG